MLGSILSSDTCRECRLCCIFDKTDLWELPILTPAEAEKAESICGREQTTHKDDEYTFKSPELSGEEICRCPLLTEKGCALPREDMPFDCRIWPFRMMKENDGGLVIAVSELCGGLSGKTQNELSDFLKDGLADVIFSYAKEHPSHVKPFMTGYKVILKQCE